MSRRKEGKLARKKRCVRGRTLRKTLVTTNNRDISSGLKPLLHFAEKQIGALEGYSPEQPKKRKIGASEKRPPKSLKKKFGVKIKTALRRSALRKVVEKIGAEFIHETLEG